MEGWRFSGVLAKARRIADSRRRGIAAVVLSLGGGGTVVTHGSLSWVTQSLPQIRAGSPGSLLLQKLNSRGNISRNLFDLIKGFAHAGSRVTASTHPVKPRNYAVTGNHVAVTLSDPARRRAVPRYPEYCRFFDRIMSEERPVTFPEPVTLTGLPNRGRTRSHRQSYLNRRTPARMSMVLPARRP